MDVSLPGSIPFGRHRGEPLSAVPTPYLLWFASAVTDRPRLVEAVRAELVRRGTLKAAATPSTPAPQPEPGERCRACGSAEVAVYWRMLRAGDRRIGCDCTRCGRVIRMLPHTTENARKADAGTDPGGILRFLIELEDRGIRVRRKGERLEYSPIPLPASLHRLQRQCMGLLSSMLSSHAQ